MDGASKSRPLERTSKRKVWKRYRMTANDKMVVYDVKYIVRVMQNLAFG